MQSAGRLLSIAAVTVAAIIAFSVYTYLGAATAGNVRNTLLENEKSKQIQLTQSLSRYVASDLDGVILRLQLLAREQSLQNADLTSDTSTQIIGAAYKDISRITAVSALPVLDKNGKYVNEGQPEGEEKKYVGSDLSFRDYAIETERTQRSYVSNLFKGLTGEYYFIVTAPIINRQTGEYIGLVGAALQTTKFFEHYGNVANIDSQLIVAVDREGTYMVAARPEFVGQNFFGEYVQTQLQQNPEIYRLYSESVRNNKLSNAMFSTGVAPGERFAVASPVYYDGVQVMTIITSTPTALIYSQVDNILFSQTIQTYILIASLVAVVAAVIIFLVRWSGTLQRSVNEKTAELQTANKSLKEKTSELEFANQALEERTQRLEKMSQFVAETNERLAVANRELAVANQQLTENDVLQKQFINIAAHELRTPIQPILGASELLEAEFTGGKDKVEITRAELDMLVRNAKRLERLSSDILQVTRIESNKLVLNRERANLNQEIASAIKDTAPNSIGSLNGHGNVQVRFEPNIDPLTVEIDRSKISEVISNLLKNALKFTPAGSIRVVSGVSRPNTALVQVIDTGKGIDPEIRPRLFNKFASKSDQGTGLGLFISKSIVEAHGGEIWAENNPDGQGTIFAFTLPLATAEDAQE